MPTTRAQAIPATSQRGRDWGDVEDVSVKSSSTKHDGISDEDVVDLYQAAIRRGHESRANEYWLEMFTRFSGPTLGKICYWQPGDQETQEDAWGRMAIKWSKPQFLMAYKRPYEGCEPPRAKFSTWYYGIVKKELNSARRAKKRRPNTSPLAPGESDEEPYHDHKGQFQTGIEKDEERSEILARAAAFPFLEDCKLAILFLMCGGLPLDLNRIFALAGWVLHPILKRIDDRVRWDRVTKDRWQRRLRLGWANRVLVTLFAQQLRLRRQLELGEAPDDIREMRALTEASKALHKFTHTEDSTDHLDFLEKVANACRILGGMPQKRIVEILVNYDAKDSKGSRKQQELEIEFKRVMGLVYKMHSRLVRFSREHELSQSERRIVDYTSVHYVGLVESVTSIIALPWHCFDACLRGRHGDRPYREIRHPGHGDDEWQPPVGAPPVSSRFDEGGLEDMLGYCEVEMNVLLPATSLTTGYYESLREYVGQYVARWSACANW